jgi:PAS domain S-box-containing protein
MTFTAFATGAIVNLFMLLGFVALFSMARRWPLIRLRSLPSWANGFLFGGMALLAMLVPSMTGPGVMFDCRSGIIGTGALLGGPVSALTSILFPCLYRLHIGGLGLVPGLLEIILPATLGSACHWWCQRREQGFTVRRAVMNSLIVGFSANGLIVTFIVLFMPRQELLLEIGSTLLVVLNGPISMALFSALLVLEKQHSENVELHSTILRTTMEGFSLVDMRGRLLEVNDAFCHQSGYDVAELLNRSIGDLDVSLPDSAIASRIQEIAAKGGERFETLHRRKDGSSFDADVSAQYLPGEKGRLVYFLRDITDRKKAEQALMESERKYKMLIETTNTGFVIIDEKGRVLDANEEYVRLLGRDTLDEIRGKPVTDWTAPHDRERNSAKVQKCLETGSVRNLEIDYLDAKGRLVPIEIHATVLPGRSHPVIMGICRDISERKRAAQEREELHAQLSQAQKMESVGRLAGGVAHDFNNMLGVIMGYADMALKDQPPGSSLQTYLSGILEAASRSENLTRQLLTFARKQPVAPKVLDLNASVESMLKMVRRLIGEEIDLDWQPGSNLLPVKIDPSQLDQILVNLSVNARDAIGQNTGKITVVTSMAQLDEEYCAGHAECMPGQYVNLVITDDGCGMSEETLSHIFEPFFTSKGIGQGTGLGLATVYGVVKQNKGSIAVSSEPGRGTTFRICLPAHATRSTESVEQVHTPEAFPTEGMTILLVEDEPAVLTTTRMMLETQGYTVLASMSPSDALRIAQEYPGKIHLLITDVVMPGMNGRDLAEKLCGIHPGLKRLFMSGHTTDIIANSGVLNRDTNFIQKPFVIKTLADKVRATLAS